MIRCPGYMTCSLLRSAVSSEVEVEGGQRHVWQTGPVRMKAPAPRKQAHVRKRHRVIDSGYPMISLGQRVHRDCTPLEAFETVSCQGSMKGRRQATGQEYSITALRRRGRARALVRSSYAHGDRVQPHLRYSSTYSSRYRLAALQAGKHHDAGRRRLPSGSEFGFCAN